jgi:hypothetical protein
MKSKKAKIKRKGSALFVVLLIVMAITILSLGYLSRSDVELACGENMILRTQMDYLAESGLEHARGLILNPQGVPTEELDPNHEYWVGQTGLQLDSNTNDFYDVEVTKLNGELNYQITSTAYREKGVERVGSSSLEVELRLDPCIAFWTQTGTMVPSGVKINGDVYCNGTLTNYGTIHGDVFASGLIGNSIEGQQKTAGELSMAWPQIVLGDYSYDQIIEANSLSDSNLAGVKYCQSNIKLSGNVNIVGMLIVDANLTITGNGNVITAGGSLPAMLVTGNLIIEDGGQLGVNGLAVVNRGVQIGGTTSITGGLFVENGIIDSGGNMTITAAPSKAAITHWPGGNPARWSPAAGAFFKSIGRL